MIIVYVADENYLGFVEKSASSLLKIHPEAKIIDIYGFNKNVPTFYNPDGYITQHDYDTEHEILHDLEKRNILTFN